MLLRSSLSALLMLVGLPYVVAAGEAPVAKGLAGQAAAAQAVATQALAPQLPVAMLKTYCGDCHTGAEAEAGFDLATLKTDLTDGETFRRWVKIHDKISAREMPPADSPQPPDA